MEAADQRRNPEQRFFATPGDLITGEGNSGLHVFKIGARRITRYPGGGTRQAPLCVGR